MMTIHELSEISGVTARALRHYDALGLLKPTAVSEAGYRLYDDAALERLQQILLFRELEFPLREIKAILESPGFDKNRALEQQITLLELKKEHIENLILLAKGIKLIGVNRKMDFTAFDTSKIDQYAKEAKAIYENTPEYKEFLEKSKDWTPERDKAMEAQIMGIFARFGELRGTNPESPEAMALARELQGFITENFYACSDKTLMGLGKMYSGGGDFTESIDNTGGPGTAEFAAKAIAAATGLE
ncbi:MerR family transcriptional regulator [Acutalibacter muris]|uniref:MerR family transcriptional regulator n=1 Tax=Acutalibacter muris TaxID=1796620 RepID=A0A1Z2XME9_9FIRM|nr:MerR family transcriptional regulator [Acutalibacter muris]ANU53714.1 MerR family transcriptional regulator [Hungateiclostridiaceae bacterium KB18]ASB39610.1 MerR family transcriptional regulator [Acutalibacter muris]MCI9543007.1 MerR family transcriptional regulator [Acutalibacter muris]QQR28901.1 MerR family transcriptional regulator [Acutalibacter muris]